MTNLENFSPRLNEFDRYVKRSWQELQMEKDFCDVILSCETRQIWTHKFVISSYSPVLRNILKQNNNPHPLIYLRRVKYKDLQNLLTFMYQGEVDVAEEDLSSFLEVAEDLNVRGLSEGNKEECASSQEDEPTSTFFSIDKSSEIKTENEIIEHFDDKSFLGNVNTNAANTNDNVSNNDDLSADSIDKANGNSIDNANDNTNGKGNDNTIGNPNEDTIGNPKKDTLDKDETKTIISTLGDGQYGQRNYKETQKNKALKVKRRQCDKCEFKCKYMYKLREHIKSFHKGDYYPCDQCESKFTSKYSLWKHVKAIHEGYCHPCEQCDYKATQKDTLKIHVLSVHEGERYLCDKCNYKFKYKCNLREHVKNIHEGERYACDQCGSKFAGYSSLTKHVKSIHEGKLHLCEQCDYKATQKGNLRRHLLKYH